jgi:hypothetical protein
MKAWSITSDDGDHSAVIFDDHRGKARARGASELDSEFMGVKIKRSPEFDQYAPGPVPVKVLMAHGWFYYCSNCEEHVYDDEPGFVIDAEDERVFCNEGCRAKYREYLANIAAGRWTPYGMKPA